MGVVERVVERGGIWMGDKIVIRGVGVGLGLEGWNRVRVGKG